MTWYDWCVDSYGKCWMEETPLGCWNEFSPEVLEYKALRLRVVDLVGQELADRMYPESWMRTEAPSVYWQGSALL